MSKLILVATPIGNLDDITRRAVHTLEKADIILAEDTRKTGILLKHLGISKKILPHHAYNEHKFLTSIVQRLREGNTVALVTDAGTPGISDPGYLLVRKCLDEHIEVECMPGPTAFVPALVLSGLPIDRFCFEGFLPARKGRNKTLEKLADETRTLVFYESPHRLLRTLDDLSTFFGGSRRISISRELTKIHEETLRGTLDELREIFRQHPPRGELVIVVEGKR
ncbi:MAG TPA: 16S rRNA (cytidine(1402)-2'-O)-methyltransferase [Bacteroidetes bacterium]|nr:16S rRNA (cytidine(1402)-2'-O)-methyltransferase [Bacteroidota bacterium]